jgi:dGTPase
MKDYGGFDHNAQALALVTALEHRYADFDGLNLTWETLEGLVKHNGPLSGDLPEAIANFPWDLELQTHAGPEAQIASLSDDIAYVNHDIDDGLRAGLFMPGELFTAPLAGPIFASVAERHPGLDLSRLIGEGSRRLITVMVADVAAETARKLGDARPQSAADVRAYGQPLAGFSEGVGADVVALKAFLYRHMYRHRRVMVVMESAQRALTQLFDAFMVNPSLLPKDWSDTCDTADGHGTARAVCDYIAGMTDNFALQEYQRIFHMEFPL